MDIEQVLTLRGGVARRREIVNAGISAGSLRRGLDSGRVIRLGRGVYASPDADQEAIRAAALGGEPACISAADRIGLWLLRKPSLLHLSVDHGRLVGETDVRVHRAPRPLTPLTVCLQVMRCLPELDALCIVESAVVKHLVTLEELRHHTSGKRDSKPRKIVNRVDPHSQSILETAARYPLREAGLAVQSQVYVKGVGRLDLFVEGRLGIEADGRQHHSGRIEFEEDRRRWNLLTAGGIPVLRVTKTQVVDRSAAYLDLVKNTLATERARSSPGPSH